MSDHGGDDTSWMDFADKDTAELKKADEFADEAKLLEQKPAEVKAPQPEPQKKEAKKEEKPVTVSPSKTVEKPKPLSNEEKRKAELLSRLNEERLIDDLFQGLSAQNKQYTANQILLKKEQDFPNFAKTVCGRFDEDTTDPDLLEDFGRQLLISLYKELKSKDLQQIWDKLKVIKTEKKKDDKDKEKKKKKEVLKQTKVEAKVEVPEVKPKQAEKPSTIKRRGEDMDDFM